MRNRLRPPLLLAGIIASYVIMAVSYNVAEPIWESPDESAHFEFVRYIQIHHSLPSGTPGLTTVIDQNDLTKEFSQAPLYYLLLAGLLSPIALPPGPYFHQNPYFTWPNHPWGNALAIHRSDEGWPYHGVSQFIHLARLLATLAGVVVLLATYGIVAAVLKRPGYALFATAWLAWAPGFLLAGARLDNDAAAMGWSAVVLLQSTSLLLAPERARPGDFALLGICLSGALLSKISTAFLLILVVVMVFIAVARDRRSGRGTLGRAISLALAPGIPVVIFLGWQLTVGKTFGGRVGAQAGFGVMDLANHLKGVSWGQFAGALQTWNGTWWNGIGVGFMFGPPIMYTLLALPLVILGGLGVWALIRRQTELVNRERMLPRARLTTTVLCLSAAPLFYATIAREAFPWVGLDSHARFTLPAAPVLALLVAFGASQLNLGPFRRPLTLGYLLSLFVLAVLTPFIFIPDLHVPIVPARLPVDASEANRPAIASFANGVDLFALDVPPALRAGQELPTTLYWRVQHTPPDNFIAFVHLVGPSGQRLAGSDVMPLEKIYPPRLWQEGEITDEKRQISVPSHLPPGNYELDVGLYHLNPKDNRITPVPIRSPDSPNVSVIAHRWRILPDTAGLATAIPASSRFGQSLILRAYAIDSGGGVTQVRLYWEATEAIPYRLVVSVQALDSTKHLVAQSDGEPVHGFFPTTTWKTGEVVRDDHELHLPRGSERPDRLVVVVYDRRTLQRLEVTSAAARVSDHFTLQARFLPSGDQELSVPLGDTIPTVAPDRWPPG